MGLPGDILEAFPIELSGGMKQRVVLVLSSILNPSLLIADEVTSALDVSTQRAVSELLVEFRDRGFVKSMIVITHDLSVLYQVADTILVCTRAAGGEGHRRHRRRGRVAPVREDAASPRPEVGVRYAAKWLTGIPGRPPSLLEPCPSAAASGRRCPLATDECAAGAAVRRPRAAPHRRVLEGGRLMLELDTCCKSCQVGAFGGSELLAASDVSFAVGAGEVVALIGERQRQVDNREDDPLSGRPRDPPARITSDGIAPRRRGFRR